MTACHGSAINLIIHQAKPPPFRDQKTMEKILIITGGNKGIGHGILEAYKRNGYRVFSVARSLKLTDGNTDENISSLISGTANWWLPHSPGYSLDLTGRILKR